MKSFQIYGTQEGFKRETPLEIVEAESELEALKEVLGTAAACGYSKLRAVELDPFARCQPPNLKDRVSRTRMQPLVRGQGGGQVHPPVRPPGRGH